MQFSVYLSSSDWPFLQRKVLVNHTKANVTDEGLFIIVDTYGRFVIQIADEYNVRTLTTQPISILPNQAIKIDCGSVDTGEFFFEVDGKRLLFGVNDVCVIPVHEKSFPVRKDFFLPLIIIEGLHSQLEINFIKLLDIISHKMKSQNERIFWTALTELKQLLLDIPSVVDLVNKEFKLDIVYKVFEQGYTYNGSADGLIKPGFGIYSFDMSIEDKGIEFLLLEKFLAVKVCYVGTMQVSVLDFLVAVGKAEGIMPDDYRLPTKEESAYSDFYKLDGMQFGDIMPSTSILASIVNVLMRGLLPLVEAINRKHNIVAKVERIAK
jgi:hypothetical protein